jgi:hypothetical protein
MSRCITIGAFQVKVRPRPLVGTKTFVKATERDMRDYEWSEGFMASGKPYVGDPRAGLRWRKRDEARVQERLARMNK